MPRNTSIRPFKPLAEFNKIYLLLWVSLFVGLPKICNAQTTTEPGDLPIDLRLERAGMQARVVEDGMIIHHFRQQAKNRSGSVVRMRLAGSDVAGEAQHTQTQEIRPAASVQRRVFADKVMLQTPLAGIRMLAYVDAGLPRYDFIAQPGSRPQDIRLAFSGIDSLHAQGIEMTLYSGPHVFTHKGLLAYQDIDGRRHKVACRFRQLGKITGEYLIAFEIGNYNREHELVIDPLIEASYWGGGDRDEIVDMRRRADGSLIVVGMTQSSDFPRTLGTYEDDGNNDPDIFVSAFAENGTDLLWSTTLGGSAADLVGGMDVTPDGRILLCGQTSSMDFEVVGSTLQTERRGSTDGFVILLTADGAAVEYAGYIGGGSDEFLSDVAWHAASRSIYLCGWTASDDFPIRGENPYQAELKVGAPGAEVRDAIVLRLDHLEDVIRFSSFLGGPQSDAAMALDVDFAGDVYLCGWSDSEELREAQNINSGGRDAFVARFGIGGALKYLRFLGGDFADEAADIALVDASLAAIVGQTRSPDFELSATPLQAELDGGPVFSDGFLALIGASGGTEYSSFIGGDLNDALHAVDVRAGRFIAMAGSSASSEFTFDVEGCSGARGISDVFAAVYDLADDALIFAGQYGGVQDDEALAAAWRNESRFFLAGNTESTDFPVGASALQAMAPWDDELNLSENAFVAQVNLLQSQEYRISGPLDFGFVPAGLSKTVIITIHNLRDSELRLTLSEGQKFGDLEIAWTGELLIEPCGSYDIAVTLSPQSSRRHGVELLIATAESEAAFRFQASSKSQADAAADVVLRVPRNLSAAPGEEFTVPVRLESTNFGLNPADRPARLTCALSFNARSFTPTDPELRGPVVNNRQLIPLAINFAPGEFADGTLLFDVPMIAGLGDSRQTLISIENVTWFDANNAELDMISSSVEHGLFKTDALWQFPDGSTRLAQPADRDVFLEVLPSVVSDGELRIRAMYPPDETLRLLISNLRGEILLDMSADLDSAAGSSDFSRDISALGSGLLFVRLISTRNTLARMVLLE